MSAISDALKEAYARSSSSTRQLAAIEITLPDPLPDLHFVNYDNDIYLNDQTYVGVAMEAETPESGAEPDNKAMLRIDGAQGDLQYFINAAVSTGENIPVKMTPFAYNVKTEEVIGDLGELDFLLLKCQYNDRVVTLELGHVAPTNMPFPSVFYDPLNSPELYR